ncbi:MAG: 5'-deoxyadenosine deaminase [Pyrinomonadaceae bacterium]|nr:5'-deoxyadenosine deaminase [Pyrinomonadaceae bacterium]
MSESILIKGGTLITMDDQDSIVSGDLLITDGQIQDIAGGKSAKAKVEIDARGCVVLPGFVQTHIHLCQTLFRGAADDLSLIDWLKKRIWPMEAAHSVRSLRASARLGIAELIKGGTTCALTMETVNHTEAVFQVVEETGYRATVGKCMMDRGEGVPSPLHEGTEASVEESLALLEKWHGKGEGRIRFCFAPRFAVSCTPELLSNVAHLAHERRVMVHTHASESRDECELVEEETGLRNITYLNSLGLTGRHVALAHCIHVDDDEIAILKRTNTNVVHCPSSNLKLGSGVAPVKRMLEAGISVSLGADGAACNNRLDMFTEMRTAALLQKALHGPEVLPAKRALRMATIDGARALDLENEIGSLEIGKRADVIVVRMDCLHSTPHPDLASAITYSGQGSDVETVVIDGRLVMMEGKLLTVDELSVVSEANREAELLMNRVATRDYMN